MNICIGIILGVAIGWAIADITWKLGKRVQPEREQL